jgi:rabenosyn-5
MSGRKLGGGRILGSGHSLSPAPSPLPKRHSSLLSPTASTVSLESSSTSNTSPDNQDIKSRVSLGNNDDTNITAAAASSRLFCPICNEEMVRSQRGLRLNLTVTGYTSTAE